MKIEINLTDDQVKKLFAKDNKDTTVTYYTSPTNSYIPEDVNAMGDDANVSSARGCQRLTDVYHGLLAAREAIVVNKDSRRALDVIDGMIDDLDNVLAEM